MSIEDADEILKDDINILEGMQIKYKKSKDSSLLLQIAQKSEEIADLYYEAFEDFNPRYYEYKLKSAEYYEKFSKELNLLNAKYLSILLYLQAGKPETAERKLKSLRKKVDYSKSKKKRIEITDELLYILDLLIVPSLKEAKRNIKSHKSLIDESLFKKLIKTFEILKKMEF